MHQVELQIRIVIIDSAKSRFVWFPRLYHKILGWIRILFRERIQSQDPGNLALKFESALQSNAYMKNLGAWMHAQELIFWEVIPSKKQWKIKKKSIHKLTSTQISHVGIIFNADSEI